jgi:hypothetical protein
VGELALVASFADVSNQVLIGEAVEFIVGKRFEAHGSRDARQCGRRREG